MAVFRRFASLGYIPIPFARKCVTQSPMRQGIDLCSVESAGVYLCGWWREIDTGMLLVLHFATVAAENMTDGEKIMKIWFAGVAGVMLQCMTE